jgi:hypothetical protein
MASGKGGVRTEQCERDPCGASSLAAEQLEAERSLARAQRTRSLEALLAEAGVEPDASWRALWVTDEMAGSDAPAFRRMSRWRRGLQRGASKGGGKGGEGGGSPLELGHPGEDSYHALTVKDILVIFHHFRSAGIAPHPGIVGDSVAEILSADIAVARAILAALQRLCDSRTAGVPEENLDPSRSFGVLNGVCFLDLDEDFEDSDREPSQMGWAWDVVVDVALMGGGFLRHQHQPDLIWSSLHHSGTSGGDLFPAPADMLATMSQDSWARMAGFTLFTIICYLSEMQQMAILFSYGPEAAPGASLSAAAGGVRLARTSPVHEHQTTAEE